MCSAVGIPAIHDGEDVNCRYRSATRCWLANADSSVGQTSISKTHQIHK